MSAAVWSIPNSVGLGIRQGCDPISAACQMRADERTIRWYLELLSSDPHLKQIDSATLIVTPISIRHLSPRAHIGSTAHVNCCTLCVRPDVREPAGAQRRAGRDQRRGLGHAQRPAHGVHGQHAGGVGRRLSRAAVERQPGAAAPPEYLRRLHQPRRTHRHRQHARRRPNQQVR